MTMEQANQLARDRTVKNTPVSTQASSAGKIAPQSLPTVVFPVSQPAPVTMNRAPVTPSPEVTGTTLKKPVSVSAALAGQSSARVVSEGKTPASVSEDDLLAARRSEHTASLWIAPWTDADQVLHQPGRLWFVVQPGQWQLKSAGGH